MEFGLNVVALLASSCFGIRDTTENSYFVFNGGTDAPPERETSAGLCAKCILQSCTVLVINTVL